MRTEESVTMIWNPPQFKDNIRGRTIVDYLPGGLEEKEYEVRWHDGQYCCITVRLKVRCVCALNEVVYTGNR